MDGGHDLKRTTCRSEQLSVNITKVILLKDNPTFDCGTFYSDTFEDVVAVFQNAGST